jgi:predicted nucleic acid-binding protein
MILDTDVLIWLMRQNTNAISLVASLPQREVAQATWLELVEGVRNKRELAEAKSLFADLNIRTLPLTESIGQRAGLLMEEHALKGGLDAMDSLIAATALVNNIPLATANRKHYKALGVDLLILKP